MYAEPFWLEATYMKLNVVHKFKESAGDPGFVIAHLHLETALTALLNNLGYSSATAHIATLISISLAARATLSRLR